MSQNHYENLTTIFTTYLLLATYVLVVTSALANTSPIQFVDAVIKRWMHSSMCGRSSKTDSDGIRERDSERPLLRIVLRVSGALNHSIVDPLRWGGMPKVLGFHLLLITFITTR